MAYHYECQYCTYCHLDIGHGMIQTGPHDADQLSTEVNGFYPRPLVVTAIPFLGALLHLGGIVGSEGEMFETTMGSD